MKKLLALLLAFAMLFTFAACGNNADEEEDDEEIVDKDKDDDDDDKEKDEEDDEDNEDDNTEDEEEITEDDDQEEETVPEKEVDAVPLHELYLMGDSSSPREKEYTNAYGDTFEGPYYDLCSYGSSYEDGEYITQGYAEYSTNGEYGYITGTFFTRSKQSEDATIEFMIYADDELVYCSEPIDRKVRSVPFAVNIGNCDVVRIASRSYDYSSNTNPGIIVVDAMVWSDYEGDLTPGVSINPDLVPLSDLYVYGDHSDVLDNMTVGKVEDSYGNVYKGIYMDLCSYGNYGGKDYDVQAYTDFVTDGQYNYFSGTFFTRKEQASDYEIEFLIYADDELIYSSGMINDRDSACDFTVEISDCEILRVMSRSKDYTDSGTNPGIILVDAFVSTEEP